MSRRPLLLFSLVALTVMLVIWFGWRRPDIELAVRWIDTYTPVDEPDPKAEFAVRYLTSVEHESLYRKLLHLFDWHCDSLWSETFGPAQYAARILGARTDQLSVEVLLDRMLGPLGDGVDYCDHRAAEGLALKGEEVAPIMLKIAVDASAPWYHRSRAIHWLGFVGGQSQPTYSWCRQNLGCEPLGREKTSEWIDTLIGLLKDENKVIRRRTASALALIGDPRGIETVERAIGLEEDAQLRESMQYDLEEHRP